MKKIIGLFIFVILGCNNKPFEGVLICKEYTPSHMCCSTPGTKHLMMAIHVPIVPHTAHVHHHTLEKATFVLVVANCSETRRFYVDSMRFIAATPGEKLRVNP